MQSFISARTLFRQDPWTEDPLRVYTVLHRLASCVTVYWEDYSFTQSIAGFSSGKVTPRCYILNSRLNSD